MLFAIRLVCARAKATRLIWPVLASITLAGGPVPHSHAFSSPPREPVPASYFSMNILFHPLNHVAWPAVPIGGWRTAHVNWADIQPQPNRWYFDLLDKYVGWSQEHKTPILMELAYTPAWASSTPDAATDVEAGNPPGLSGAPRNMEDWKTYVKTVATRYKGRIHDWEIWNEPNRPQSWTGSVDTLVEMTREASAVLKQVDPTNVVVSPAATETRGLAYLDAFLQKGGGEYVDVIGFHFYVGRQSPEAMVTLIEGVEKLLAQHGLSSKPLWNTEAGWLGADPLPPQTQAAYLARAYILNWAFGVSRFYWYAWENHRGTRIELVGPDNASLTPAGRAFGGIQKWMTDAVLTGCSAADNGVWTCGLERGNRALHLVWNASSETTFSVPGSWSAHEAEALDGGRTPIRNNTISTSISPVLVD